MPYRRDKWKNKFRQQRATQIRRRYRQQIGRNRLKGDTDHDRRRTITQEQLEHAHDSNAYDLAMYDANPDAPAPANPAPSPHVPPSQSPQDYADRPASQSSGQGSGSHSTTQSGTSRDESESKEKPQTPASSQPSTSGFPQDIEWSPLDEASGLVPFVQAAAQGTRDSSEDKTTVVCEALYAADREGVARGLKIMTGCTPDEEQDVLPALIRLARSVGMDDYLMGVEAWYTTRLGPSEPFAASAAGEAPVPDQAQVPAEADGFEQPEISLLLQWGLTEEFPGERDRSWTTKAEAQDFLVADLKRIIPEYDETARVVPGFDETEINWADLTLEESLALYRVEIALELAARADHYEGFLPAEYDEMKASLDRATKLESLAGPIPLDDTEAYAAAFAGRAYVPDAEHERRHVENQLKLIYDQILGEESDHLATLSTTELKYELYYRLNYDVLPFVKSDEHAIQLRISDFMKDYTSEAGDTPKGAIDRLQGSFRQPDVVGFLFIMGLSIAFEPVDYVLTAIDVIQALSEGDTESAIGNAILGATPFVSSKMDDLAQPIFSRIDNVPLLPARAGSLPGQGYQRPGSNYVMAVDSYADRTVSNYNSRNAGLLNTQMEKAAKVDDRFAWRLKTHSDQQMHHIMPTGRWQGDRAREILSEKGVYVNSAYNGIALDKPIHRLTNSAKYTAAISEVIVELKHASPEDIAEFLEETAKRLQKLNGYPKGDLLKAKFQSEIMDWFAGYMD